MLDRRARRRAGAAVVSADLHRVCSRLHDTGGDDSDAGLRDELDADAGGGVKALQVEDELREILDAVDVVMDRRRDQRDAGLRVPQARDVVDDLRGRQLSALSRLRALRDLDLDLVRRDQVPGRHAEPRGRDLFDGAAVPVRPRSPAEAFGLFSPFAAVASAAKPVHRDRDDPMRLRAQRADRHRRREEPAADPIHRLDLVYRHWLGRTERQKVPDRGRRPLRDEPRERPVRLFTVRPGRPVELAHDNGVVGVILAVPAVGVESRKRGRAVRLAIEDLARQITKRQSPERRRRAREESIDDRRRRARESRTTGRRGTR